METVIRVAIIYILITAGLRVMGKREFGQLSPIELVALLMIPELVAQALVREDFSMTNAVIAITTLFTLVFSNSFLSFHSKFFEKMVSGSPVVLIANGKIQEDAVNKERVSADEILAQAHKSGIEKLDNVKWAILESDGKISIVPKDTHNAVFQVRNDENFVK